MKTVVDAVNAFKGDIENGAARYLVSFDFANSDLISYVISKSSFSMGVCPVCTTEEFNQCVAEMSEAKWIPESKPVFTQAMADAGELPPVGMLVQIKSLNDPSPCFINGSVIHVMHGEVWYRDDKRGNCITFTDKLMFKPIKTEREKAIDEMQEVVCSQGFLAKMDVSFGIAEEIYNANYRKLTPSQAKAYDDKTEYFGEDYK